MLTWCYTIITLNIYIYTEADADISIKEGGVFLKENFRISKQFILRKVKRYRSVIQSENYKA